MLKSYFVQHMIKELNIGLLKHEFLSIRKQLKAERLAVLQCFNDVLERFQKICPCINHQAICPKFWRLMRLLALHAATTATCERIFKLNRIVKTNIISTMTENKRIICAFAIIIKRNCMH